MNTDDLKNLVRTIPDFPKPGIMYRDITPLLADARGFSDVIERIAKPHLGQVDAVVGIESRGFIFGAPVAYRLGVGLTIARKPGKLPFETVEQAYELEYGVAALQMHRDALGGGARVLIVDDLLATGGTARAACDLVRAIGGSIVACAFVIELTALGGRARLAPVPCSTLIGYD